MYARCAVDSSVHAFHLGLPIKGRDGDIYLSTKKGVAGNRGKPRQTEVVVPVLYFI